MALAFKGKWLGWLAVFLSLVALTGSCSHAPQPPVDSAAQSAPSASSLRPFLYEAVHEGQTSYLFGTIHTGVDAEKDLPPTVWQALKNSRCLIMETDLSAVSPADVSALTTLPPGKKLKDMVKPHTWEKVVAHFGPDLSEATLNRMKPWVVLSGMIQSLVPPTPPMDEAIKKRALQAKLPVVYLESPKQQIAILSQVVGPADLDELVESEDESLDLMTKLVGAYRSGSEQTIGELLFTPAPGFLNRADQLDLLFTKRNRTWIPLIASATKDRGCFVSVGAGHLFGDNGLIRLLGEQGYAVRRLPAAAAK